MTQHPFVLRCYICPREIGRASDKELAGIMMGTHFEKDHPEVPTNPRPDGLAKIVFEPEN